MSRSKKPCVRDELQQAGTSNDYRDQVRYLGMCFFKKIEKNKKYPNLLKPNLTSGRVDW